MNNYIPDRNPFNLAGPPQWWLKKLWDFDPSLVVLPSRREFLYRLAQRRKLNLADKFALDLMKEDADFKMMASYGLVPVTTILSTARWDNPYLFVELANRAPWRLGGADKVNAMLDEQDQKDELDKRARTNEHLSYLSKDAWRLYNKKIGTRTHMWTPTTPQRRPASKSPLIKIA